MTLITSHLLFIRCEHSKSYNIFYHIRVIFSQASFHPSIPFRSKQVLKTRIPVQLLKLQLSIQLRSFISYNSCYKWYYTFYKWSYKYL